MQPRLNHTIKQSDTEWNRITCTECGGCISCTDSFCVYNVGGDRNVCYPQSCSYCRMYYQKSRLFLNNVG